MLLLSKNKKYEIGDTIHFAANTSKNDGFFKYSYNGLVGNYSGHFIREPFFKKIYEYNTLEQRHMFIYDFKLKKEEIKKLIYHLFEIRKATFKYYFLNGNCASRTTDLLNILDINKNKINNIFYLPLDTLKEYQHLIKYTKKFTPLLNKLTLLISKMTNTEFKLFNRIIENKEHVKIATSDIIKESLVYYTIFNFRKFRKINSNYNDIVNQTYIKKDIKDPVIDPLKKIAPSHISLNINKNYSTIEYRPLFIDLSDIQSNNLQESQINAFKTNIKLKEDTFKLNRFDIVNIVSLPTQLSFYKPISWNIYFGTNRENPKAKLKLNTEIGVGKTYQFLNNIKFSLLINTGIENEDLYIKPLINLSKEVNKKIKIGFKYYHKEYNNFYFEEKEVSLNIKRKNSIYALNIIKDSYEKEKILSFSYKYNF